MPCPYKGSFSGVVGLQVVFSRKAVGFARAVWVVEHDGHQALTRFALAEKFAGRLVVYRAAAERTANMGTRDGALLGIKIHWTAVLPDDFEVQTPGVLVRDEFEGNLLLILFCQPPIGSEGNLYAARGVLARDGAHPVVTNRE
jgi:hypothetical protein